MKYFLLMLFMICSFSVSAEEASCAGDGFQAAQVTPLGASSGGYEQKDNCPNCWPHSRSYFGVFFAHGDNYVLGGALGHRFKGSSCLAVVDAAIRAGDQINICYKLGVKDYADYAQIVSIEYKGVTCAQSTKNEHGDLYRR